MELRNYQIETINHLLENNYERECICLATGSGKTQIFSSFAGLMGKQNKTGLILVNRIELLQQTKNTLKNNYSLDATLITSETNTNKLKKNTIYVAMIETLYRRKKALQYLSSICEYLIVDECHRAEFLKVIEGFKRVIGFTATPLLARKNDCLKNYYYNLYNPITIRELIENNYLCPATTYVPAEFVENRKGLKMNYSGTDYDQIEIGKRRSTPKYVNIVKKYIKKYCKDKRTIIYNSSVEQSKIVCETLQQAGFNAYHVDGITHKEERERLLLKLKQEQDCIVCNVDILTFGFDCPEIEVIMLNRLTKSEGLFVQMCGRGSRLAPNINKKEFKILDMTGNYDRLGVWEQDREWEYHFENIDKKKDGEAPVKLCPDCEMVVHANVKICPNCGQVFIPPLKEAIDDIDPELIVIQKIEKFVKKTEDKGHNIYRSLHLIKEAIYEKTTQEEEGLQTFLSILPNWCKETGKRHNQWHKDYVSKIFKEYCLEQKKEVESIF